MKVLVAEIKVGIDFGSGRQPVGRLAKYDRTIFFEYSDSFIQSGMEISPFRLPIASGLMELPPRPFEGLAGVFSDSLPDGWGRLLFDRMARSQGIQPGMLSPLDRLANVGLYGMGALVYEPDNSVSDTQESIDLDQLSAHTQEVLAGSSDEVIEELLALNGSSAGARPKALIGVDKHRQNIIYGVRQLTAGMEPWIVKFANTQDSSDTGAIEYVYALMAKAAGVDMPETHLFPSKNGAGYFAVQRFDRAGNNRLHMHTAGGLLHSDFRVPALDYEDLLNLTGMLTKDIREVKKMYRLAVFNVLSNNRDDHAKNFSFLMDKNGEWKMAPAYDLIFSSGPGGEQSTMVMGEGKNPTIKHLEKLGMEARFSKGFINEVVEQTIQALGQWKTLSSEMGVTNANIKGIATSLKRRL